MRRHRPRLLTCGAAFVVIATLLQPANSLAEQLLLHLPLDGTLRYSGVTGEPRLLSAGGAAQPDFVPGQFGQALRLDGKMAVAMPFSLDHAAYPQVTVTAWVREEPGASGSREIVSSTSPAGFRLGIHGGQVALRLGDRGITFDGAEIVPGQWVYVAVMVNTQSGQVRVMVDRREWADYFHDYAIKPPELASDPDNPDDPPQAWLVIGANNIRNFASASRPLMIDDVRVFAGDIGYQKMYALRNPKPQTTYETADVALPDPDAQVQAGDLADDGPAGLTDGGSITQIDTASAQDAQRDCESSDECDAGFYCAIERVCHPNEHAPIESLRWTE